MRQKIEIIFILLIIITISINITKRTDPDFISCNARFMTQLHDEKASMIMRFIFNENTGVVILDGDGVIANGQVMTLDRKIKFSYIKNNNSYYLTNQDISIKGDDNVTNEFLRHNLPDFFSRRSATINYGIYNQGHNNYVFAMRKIPSFICIH